MGVALRGGGHGAEHRDEVGDLRAVDLDAAKDAGGHGHGVAARFDMGAEAAQHVEDPAVALGGVLPEAGDGDGPADGAGTEEGRGVGPVALHGAAFREPGPLPPGMEKLSCSSKIRMPLL